MIDLKHIVLSITICWLLPLSIWYLPVPFGIPVGSTIILTAVYICKKWSDKEKKGGS